MKLLRLLPAEVPIQYSEAERAAARQQGVPLKPAFGTADLVRAALNHKPAQGYTASDLRARGKVEDALDAALTSGREAVHFEDDQAVTLQRCVEATTWNIRSRELLGFLDAVKDMPTVDPNGPAAPTAS